MKFWLVQRMEAAPNGVHANPFRNDDRMSEQLNMGVVLDYMGAAEFEFGAVPRSGNRIASVANELRIVTRQVVTPVFEEPVHFLATPQQEQDGLIDSWFEWVADPHSKEDTYYFNDRSRWPYAESDFATDYVGWWALNEDLIWARDEERAETFRATFVQLAEQASTQRTKT